MDHTELLAREILHLSKESILHWMKTFKIKESELNVPDEALPSRLLYMIQRCEDSTNWPTTKIMRWIGYIHGCMICLNICRLENLKEMVSDSKIHFQEGIDDELMAHHDPENPFRLDMGGEG